MAARRAPTTLYERDEELGLLHDLVDGASAGRGGTVVLEAAPGLGKSSLLADVATYATGAGFDKAVTAGHELEQDFGWGAARALFEPVLRRLSTDARRDLLSGPAQPAAGVVFPADARPGFCRCGDGDDRTRAVLADGLPRRASAAAAGNG